MTNAEAITALSEMRADLNCFDGDEEPYYRALSMAIAALNQQAEANDLISRAAAQEEIARRDTTDGTVKVFSGREVNEILANLPSAQPDRHFDESTTFDEKMQLSLKKAQLLDPKMQLSSDMDDLELKSGEWTEVNLDKNFIICPNCGAKIKVDIEECEV